MGHDRHLGVACGLAIFVSGLSSVAVAQSSASEVEVQEEVRYARDLSKAFEHAAERVGPSVVHITTKARVQSVSRDIFGRRLIGPERLMPTGLGSGVVADKRGYILTNYHVVKEADVLVVKMNDGRELDAEIVGTDEQHDLAVLKVDADDLQPAEFGDSESLRVGEWVLAIGSPFGFDNSVTAGIVSATGRHGIGLVSERFKDYEDYIQTDAAINPGNSGGPLINIDGEVVGINSAIISKSGGSMGIGFAIPTHIAKTVMQNLIEKGSVGRGWLGVTMQDLTPELARSFHLKEDQAGVVVADVIDDGPAKMAGLKSGDVIVGIADRPVESAAGLISAIEITPPGTATRLHCFREGKPIDIDVKIGNRNERNTKAFGGKPIDSLGVTVATVDHDVTRELGYRDGDVTGVLITEIRADSPLAKAGLEPEDIIYGVGGYRVEDVDSFRTLMDRADLDYGVRLQVIRGLRRGYVVVQR